LKRTTSKIARDAAHYKRFSTSSSSSSYPILGPFLELEDHYLLVTCRLGPSCAGQRLGLYRFHWSHIKVHQHRAQIMSLRMRRDERTTRKAVNIMVQVVAFIISGYKRKGESVNWLD
jgi:hypothetical protein